MNYWWDDASAPHGVTNLTWPSPDDDASYLTDAFRRFLEQRRQSTQKLRGGSPAPFAAQISFHNCHKPFVGTNSSKEACKRGETCKPPVEGDEPYTDLELDYYACLTQLDTAVGEVIRSLEENGYYENTFVMLASDNGEFVFLELYYNEFVAMYASHLFFLFSTCVSTHSNMYLQSHRP